VFEEHALDPAVHDRTDFDCGVAALNEYLQRYAGQHRKCGIGSTYVLVAPGRPERILGYYTLSAAEVDSPRLAESERRRLPRYPVPCFRLGRLACRLDERGCGLGKRLLACAVERCLVARAHVAAYALVVDAKDDDAMAFYVHYGFKPLGGGGMSLYLPLGPITRTG
jgi:predicted GNAT family N-acyltransferase